jgi:shikimate dehydrogenase
MSQLPDTAKRLLRADGTPRPVGVIGYPVAHSRSPVFQNAAFAHYGLPHKYERYEVKPEALGDFLSDMKSQDFLGLNVTIPHKEAVLESLETGTEEVGETGAANTLFLHEDQYLAGHNTDIGGFLETLKEQEINIPGSRILLLGAGGAARAIAYALAKEGAVEIGVVNRTVARAEELCQHFVTQFPRCHIYPMPYDSAGWPMGRNPRELVVNTLPIGLKSDEQDIPYPFNARDMAGKRFERTTLFYDLLYGETPFLKQARADGAERLQDGTKMLVYQGALSFELWTGLPAPRDKMLEALNITG